MIDESEIRHEIGRALRGDSSINDLYLWLMARNWNMHKDSEPAAIELAESVEALLFKYSDGDLSKDGLRYDLQVLTVELIEQAWEVSDEVKVVARAKDALRQPQRSTTSSSVITKPSPAPTKAASHWITPAWAAA